MKRQITAITFFTLLVLMGLGCGGNKTITLDPKQYSDKQLYEVGQQNLKNEDYEMAREAFRVVFDNYPKSDYRILAKLSLADSYYQQGNSANYVLAIQEYQDFISLFPFSPKAEYAQFQIGMSYSHMLEKPDRDQTETRKALEEFRKVIDNYPDGQYYRKAYDKLLECYGRLAEHEFLVGRFYQKTGRHGAAIDRFKGILKDYPEPVFRAKHYYGLAKSLEETDQFSESCTYYATLLEKWPDSEFTEDAQESRRKVCTAQENTASN